MQEYKNEQGELHNENGPAVIDDNYQAWYRNGKLHRTDGPAVIDGDIQVWYLDGKLQRINNSVIF